MKVLVAPDKFRGTLSAAEAARAIATGWRRGRPTDEVVELPLADGGEGTLEAMVDALGGTVTIVRVRGPLGDPVDAGFGLAERAEGTLGIVEMARASGLALTSRRDPLRASTFGTGELIAAAVAAGARSLLVCIGGSATTDGGAGVAQALGARLLDADGRAIPPGGAGLLELARVELGALPRTLRDVRIVVACDVRNPLTGPLGAARTFGPQKGASPEQVVLLERALGHLAAVLHRDLGVDVREVPGGGAAGGLGAGLVAFAGARLRPGVEVVMEAVGFDRRLAEADLVITGEGSVDRTSLGGKVVGAVVAEARNIGRPARVLCGEASVALSGAEVASLVERFGRERALGAARAALVDLAAEVAVGAQPVPSPS